MRPSLTFTTFLKETYQNFIPHGALVGHGSVVGAYIEDCGGIEHTKFPNGTVKRQQY